MPQPMQNVTCQCGKVVLEVRGTPIVATTCHCSGCKEAGHILQGLPNAPRILDADGGTGFILFRKDRVACVLGQEHLKEHRLSSKTPTRRVVATCCNSFMFLDFTKGHWITLVANRIDTGPAGAPRSLRQSPFFFARLLAAWAAMGFKTPEVTYGRQKLKGPFVDRAVG